MRESFKNIYQMFVVRGGSHVERLEKVMQIADSQPFPSESIVRDEGLDTIVVAFATAHDTDHVPLIRTRDPHDLLFSEINALVLSAEQYFGKNYIPCQTDQNPRPIGIITVGKVKTPTL